MPKKKNNNKCIICGKTNTTDSWKCKKCQNNTTKYIKTNENIEETKEFWKELITEALNS